MIRSIINKAVKAALDELFVDAPSVQLSMGADIFSDSKINLSNLTLRPDIFDISLHPFSLVHGHVGSLNVEGIAELALGGKLKFNAENLFLLFEIDSIADPEKVQTIKKIILELQSGRFSPLILSELLRRLQGLSTAPDVDVLNKRRVIYKALDYVSRGVFLSIRNIHVRFEFRCNDTAATANSSETVALSLCNALGVMIPLIKFVPAAVAQRPEGISRSDPCFLMGVKSAQVYCDYQRESYFRRSGSTFSAVQIVQHFTTQWRQEVHSALVAPFDVDIVVGLGIKRRAGLVCPNVVVRLPALRLSVDERQIAVLAQIALELAQAKKKFEQAVKIQKIFRNGFPLPRVHAVVGIRLLPHLLLKGQPYPSQYNAIPRSSSGGLVAFMRERVGARWTVMLWKHLIRIVLHDLQKTRPLGRWIEIARLAALRKDYAFLYAQFFKKIGETGQFVFNPTAAVSAAKARQLFEYEMQLTPHAVATFRSLAYMLAVAGGLYQKKKLLASTQGGGGGRSVTAEGAPGWEKTFIGWKEVLCVHTELFEAQRETAFHRFDRSRQDASEDAEDAAWDDNATVRSDDNSVYSFAMRSSMKNPHTPSRTPRVSESPSHHAQAKKPGIQKFFNNFSLSNITAAFTPADDFDRKILGKFDLGAFGDAFSSFADQSSTGKIDRDVDSTLSADAEAALRRGPSSARAVIPDAQAIAEAVEWAMQKYQDAITWLPPDIRVNVERVQCELKSPASITHRERHAIAALSLRGVSATVNISQSSSDDHGFSSLPQSAVNGTPSAKTPPPASHKMGARGFASLSGALVQFRVVCRNLSLSLQLAAPAQLGAVQSAPPTQRSLGLPAYPIAISLKREESSDSLHSSSTQDITVHTQREGEKDSVVSADPDAEQESQTVSVTHTEIRSEKALKNIPGATLQYKAGETVLQSLQRMRMERDAEDARKMMEEMSDSGADAARGGALAGKTFTIDSPFDDNASAAAAQKREDSSSVFSVPIAAGEMKEILSSAPADNALVWCTILDLDEQGDGAGDVQLQLGGFRVDLSKRVAATLAQRSFSERVGAMLRHKQAIDEAVALGQQPLVLVDWAQRAPLVLLAVDPPLSVLDELLEREKLTSHTTHASHTSFSASKFVSMSHSQWQQNENDSNTVSTLGEEASVLIDDSQDSVRAALAAMYTDPRNAEDNKASHEETLLERRQRRAAIAFNKNIMQWLAVLEARLPKVLSVCVRTSPIVVQSLEAVVIRDLIHAKMQAIVDNASQRRKDSGLTEFFPIEHVLGLLHHLVLSGFDSSEENVEFNNRVAEYRRRRRWGARASMPHLTARRLNFTGAGGNPSQNAHPAVQSAFKLKMLIPGIDLVIAKALVPYPAVDVHLQSLNVLKLPMSDETLCYYLAWILAELMPIYF